MNILQLCEDLTGLDETMLAKACNKLYKVDLSLAQLTSSQISQILRMSLETESKLKGLKLKYAEDVDKRPREKAEKKINLIAVRRNGKILILMSLMTLMTVMNLMMRFVLMGLVVALVVAFTAMVMQWGSLAIAASGITLKTNTFTVLTSYKNCMYMFDKI